MREIHVSSIVDAVKKLCTEANYSLEPDMLRAFAGALEKERSPAGRQVLQILQQNAELAKKGFRSPAQVLLSQANLDASNAAVRQADVALALRKLVPCPAVGRVGLA